MVTVRLNPDHVKTTGRKVSYVLILILAVFWAVALLALGAWFVLQLQVLMALLTIPIVIALLVVINLYLKQYMYESAFEKTVGSISKASLELGDEFEFWFEQGFRHTMSVGSCTALLLFQEVVRYKPKPFEDTPIPLRFNRLMGTQAVEGCTVQAGGKFTGIFRFRIPNRKLGLRHPFGKEGIAREQGRWIVRISYLAQGETLEINEFWLEGVSDDIAKGTYNTEHAPNADLCDLYLTGLKPNSLGRVYSAQTTVFPIGYQVPLDDVPCVMLENRHRVELEQIKTKLESAGAIMEIQPSRYQSSQ